MADVLARHYRQKLGKDNVYFLTGTDEHGAKIAESAAKLNIDPQTFTDQISAQFKTAWKNLDISYDQFIRTTDAKHKKIVQEILVKLKAAKTPLNNDCLYQADYEGLYCVGCESFKTEKDLPMIHTVIGKRSFTEEQLSENFIELYNALKQNKPTKASPEWVKNIFIATSMGQSVIVDHTDL